MTHRLSSKPPSGFTLAELLVGVTLSAMLMAAVLSTYVYLARNLARLSHQQTVEAEMRRTLGYFSQDVQEASSVAIVTRPAPDLEVAFTHPGNGSGAAEIIYCYSRDGAARTIHGGTVNLPARTLVRIVSQGGVLTGEPQTLLRNIVDTDDGCAIRFFDGAGKSYDNGVAPFTPVATYTAGIKQASLQLAARSGNPDAGTATRVYQMASSRLLLRNRTWLP